jgi:hypothetical protein
MPRRFPTPWSIEESSAFFIVRDGDKQALVYVYFENEPVRRSSARLLTRDEAFLIAVNIAKLPMVPRQILKDIPGRQIQLAPTTERECRVRFTPESCRDCRRTVRPLRAMYGRRPRCKRNLTFCEAFGCSHVSGLFSPGGLPPSRCGRCGRWP